MIAVESLSVAYGAARVVDDVSFQVGHGEVFGLLGESGSGKTTILRCLCGLERRWSGRITIDGQPLSAHRRAMDRARLMQMVFQDPWASLHPRHIINTALLEPIRIHRLEDGDGRVDRALAEVGLDTSIRFRFPHQLSGGQRQRVAIARALILEPRLLLLDEPSSALDVSVQAEILNLLCGLQARRGLAMILVSHDLTVAAHIADRIAVMQEGSLLETATALAFAAGEVTSAYSRQLIQASAKWQPDRAPA